MPKISLKNQLFIFIGIFAAFFITAIYFQNIFQNKYDNKEKILKNFCSTLQNKENDLDNIILKTKNQIDANGIFSLFDFFGNESLLEEGFTLLCFQNDTLKYWSDNTVPVNNKYNYSQLAKEFNFLSNGWYRIINKKFDSITITGLILVKYEYQFQNDYLENNFHEDFDLPENSIIIFDEDVNPVFTKENNYLFSFLFPEERILSENTILLLFTLYLFVLLAFIAIIYTLHKMLFVNNGNAYLLVFGFIFDIFLVRFVIFHYKIPCSLYSSKLFSPLFFASSELLPSFGDLIVNAIVVLIAAMVFYKQLKNLQIMYIGFKRVFRLLTVFTIVVILGLMFFYIINKINSIVIDSTIPYTLNNIFNLNCYSLIGFIVIVFVLLSFSLVSFRCFDLIFKIENKNIVLLAVYAAALVILAFISLLSGTFSLFSFISFTVYVIGMWLFYKQEQKYNVLARLIFNLIFFSLVSSHVINHSVEYKEQEKIKSLAQKLSASQDPIAEFMYKELEKNLLSDTILQHKICFYPQTDTEIKEYIADKYLKGYWSKFKIQITACNPNDTLVIEPSFVNRNCADFFDELRLIYGRPTPSPNLMMLNYGTGGNSYIAELKFKNDTVNTTIYIEFNSKFIPKGLGYPELLIDKRIFLNTDLSNYSYARYKNNELIDAYGKYYYRIIANESDTAGNTDGFYNKNGYLHFFYKIDENSHLTISREQGNVLEYIAPFSMLFLFFSLITVVIIIVTVLPYNKNLLKLNFKNRLQISIISLIFISFFLIGVSMYYYIRNVNENKNMVALSEKAFSILIEVQSKISDCDSFNPDINSYLANLLVKFSNVFFTDINFYDLNGNLIASSRPQIFNEGLISPKIQPNALKELAFKNKTIIINKEKIGNLQYYSAYLPFYNNKNQLIAYLNLPYFAKENELKQELSTFLMTFINIYVFLIAISVIIALIVANRMTRPLNEIKEKISRVQLGGKNEKISWAHQHDEIGSLVNEYNRMIDELALSAELLAKSERESAWREMARQVAHEIKNPLTPMKLSVQHLNKAWNDKTPDWDDRFKRFTSNLIEQIDSLSAIASAFSDFAKMPRAVMEKVNIAELAANSLETFKGINNINICIEKTEEEIFVNGDKKQIIRALNNLLLNAVYAIGDKTNGTIIINIKTNVETVITSISDNGCGIHEDQSSRIFTPYFSTKSEGMGLGLAIVKSIAEAHGGNIRFNSKLNEGTTFYFELPIYES